MLPMIVIAGARPSPRAAARARNLIVHGDVEHDASRARLDTVLEILGALVEHPERQTSGAA